MDVDSGYTNLAMGYLTVAEDLNLNFQPTALSNKQNKKRKDNNPENI
jgi:hypothetical protein